MISDEKHGFLEKRSTVTNLAVFTQFESEILDNWGQVDAIYLDIQKAFDQIVHPVLLTKVFEFGMEWSLESTFCPV